MTERLYYDNSGLLEFEAVIIETGAHESGHFTVLDRSAFYPTSGGQMHDTGSLNEVPVIDIIETDDERVLHITSKNAGDTGERVSGVVDKNRRRRNRQNHTAQHILSGAFVKLYDLDTVSMHLGEEYANIELPVKSVTEEQLLSAERLANEIVADNLPVEILAVDSSDAADLPLRKIPERSGKLRIIRIGEFDYSACGGTHCDCTAEVGLIKIIGLEKMRGRVAIGFLAGDLAREDYVRRFAVTDRISRRFTCHHSEIETKLDGFASENKQLRKSLSNAQKQLLPIKADQLAAEADTSSRIPLLLTQADDIEASIANQLAGMVADKIEGLAVLLIDGRLILAVAKDTDLHAGKLAKTLAEETDLKGGGSERMAQLGGASAEEMDTYREKLLTLIANE